MQLAEELTAKVGKVVWRSKPVRDADGRDDGEPPEVPVCIALCTDADGNERKVIAPEDGGNQLVTGAAYRFVGVWATGAKGEEFRAEGWTPIQDDTAKGMIAYLVRYATGVGPVIAGRIVQAFGTAAVATVRDDPRALVRDGMFHDIDSARLASESLTHAVRYEREFMELLGLLAGRGFPRSMTSVLVRRFGPNAPRFVRRNPYLLLPYDGAGWRRCDQLYRDLGLPLGAVKRQLLCLLFMMDEDGTGHTWHEAQGLCDTLVSNVGRAAADPRATLALGIRAGKLATRRARSMNDTKGVLYVATKQAADAERRLASRLVRVGTWARLKTVPTWLTSGSLRSAVGSRGT